MFRPSAICLTVWIVFASAAPMAVAAELDWNVVGSPDFFNPIHWSPPQVPTAADNAYIRNGHSSQANSGGPIAALNLTIGDAANDGNGALSSRVDLLIGDNLLVAAHRSSQAVSTGSASTTGNLIVDNAALVRVGPDGTDNDFLVGAATLDGGSGLTASGRTHFTGVTTVDIGDDLRIGAVSHHGGSADVDGIGEFVRIEDFRVADDVDIALSVVRGEHAVVTGSTNTQGSFGDIANFDIGGNLGVGRYFYHSGAAAPFDIRHESTASAQRFSDIETFSVDGSVEVGVANVDFQSGAGNAIVELTSGARFERIETLEIGGDLRIAEVRGNQEMNASSQFIKGQHTAAFDQVAHATIAGRVNVGAIDLAAGAPAAQPSASYDLQSQWGIEFSRVSTGAPTSIAVLSGTADVRTRPLFGELIMAGGTLQTPALRMAVVESGGTLADVSARGRLLLASFIDTESLVLGQTASLRFHLGGVARSTLGTFDGTFASLAGHYSAIDAADALLEGDIISDFDFVPPSPGTYSFDLVKSDSLAALNDTTANLSIADMPPGFCILFYGVAEEAGQDILRLTISTTCIPEPSTAALAIVGLAAAVPLRRRRR